MRSQLNKLVKGKSTASERRFSEHLKRLHIPFQTKIIINNHEIDFIIGKYAIEIGAHEYSIEKNRAIWSAGLFPIYIYNWNVNKKSTLDWLKQIWQREQA